MATFTYMPDWGATPELEPRVRSVQFGDGYSQDAPDGLNTILPVWKLTFSKRTQAEAQAIYSWLIAQNAHYTRFDWAAPGEGVAAGELFATGDGARLAYSLVALSRPCTVVGTPTIYRNGVLLVAGVDYTITPSGLVTLTSTVNPVVSQNLGTASGSIDTFPVVTPNGSTPTVLNVWRTDWQGTVAFEGDSISVQWPFLLNLPTSLIPENYAVAGSTTTAMAARFDIYKANRYVGFAVLGGINDLATDVAIGTIQANLTAMWGGAKALGMTVVAMTVMPWKGNATYWTAGRQAVTDALNSWIISEASANGYLLVDTFTLMEDPLNPDYLLPAYDSGDGLHPSAAGKAAIASAVGSVINTLAPRHLLSTVSRTNILTQSNDFANVASWSRVNVTSTPGETDPDGGTTASLLTASDTAALQIYSPLVAATSTTMVASVYTKAGTRALARFILRNNTTALNFQSGTFTYATGLVSGPGWVVATMLDGWFRLSFKATTGITAGDNLRLYTGDLGNVVTGGETWRLWKAQIEADRLTPPITTTTAAVTVTDWSQSGSNVVFASNPLAGALIEADYTYVGGLGVGNTLTWTGSYTRKHVAKFGVPKPDGFNSWSITADFREVPA